MTAHPAAMDAPADHLVLLDAADHEVGRLTPEAAALLAHPGAAAALLAAGVDPAAVALLAAQDGPRQ